jgi:hypothetical protein
VLWRADCRSDRYIAWQATLGRRDAIQKAPNINSETFPRCIDLERPRANVDHITKRSDTCGPQLSTFNVRIYARHTGVCHIVVLRVVPLPMPTIYIANRSCYRRILAVRSLARREFSPGSLSVAGFRTTRWLPSFFGELAEFRNFTSKVDV